MIPYSSRWSRANYTEILPLKIGQTMRMEVVRESIDRLFRTGRYADIQVDAEPYQDGILVRFVTKNSWFTGDVQVHGGSSPPGVGQLENATRLDLGRPYTEARSPRRKPAQQHLLELNGLYSSTFARYSIGKPAAITSR